MRCISILLAHDPLSSLTYPRIPRAPHVAGNLPIETLVARQWPTIYNVCNTIKRLVAIAKQHKVCVGHLPAMRANKHMGNCMTLIWGYLTMHLNCTYMFNLFYTLYMYVYVRLHMCLCTCILSVWVRLSDLYMWYPGSWAGWLLPDRYS